MFDPGGYVARLRIIFLFAALAALSWFQFVNTASAREVGQSALDLFDPRPPRDILFVGNSRMYSFDMPQMVRRIANSADAPFKYRVRMWALPGETFPGHRANATLWGLIGQEWDNVVLQAESGAHNSDRARAAFHGAGAALIERAMAGGAHPSLIVNWTYGEAILGAYPGARESQFHLIQQDYRALAAQTGASLIDAGSAWRRMEAQRPSFDLAPDGNHPSAYGSYLTALMIYGHLNGGDISKVTYAPDTVSADDAAAIRAVAADLLAAGLDPPAPAVTP